MSPACLPYSWNFTIVSHFSKANPADSKHSHETSGSTTYTASVISSNRVFLFTLLIRNHRFFCHYSSFSLNGRPIDSRRASPSSSLSEVVTKVIEKPLTLFPILSKGISGNTDCSFNATVRFP